MKPLFFDFYGYTIFGLGYKIILQARNLDVYPCGGNENRDYPCTHIRTLSNLRCFQLIYYFYNKKRIPINL